MPAIESAIKDVKNTATLIQTSFVDMEPGVCMSMAAAGLNGMEFVEGYIQPFPMGVWQRLVALGGRSTDLCSPRSTRTTTRSCAVGDAEATGGGLCEKGEGTANLEQAAELQGQAAIEGLLAYAVGESLEEVHDPLKYHKGKRQGFKKTAKPRWIGPGRVLFQEVLVDQETDDERRHIVWVVIGRTIMRCSVHSVRPLTRWSKLWKKSGIRSIQWSGRACPT